MHCNDTGCSQEMQSVNNSTPISSRSTPSCAQCCESNPSAPVDQLESPAARALAPGLILIPVTTAPLSESTSPPASPPPRRYDTTETVSASCTSGEPKKSDCSSPLTEKDTCCSRNEEMAIMGSETLCGLDNGKETNAYCETKKREAAARQCCDLEASKGTATGCGSKDNTETKNTCASKATEETGSDCGSKNNVPPEKRKTCCEGKSDQPETTRFPCENAKKTNGCSSCDDDVCTLDNGCCDEDDEKDSLPEDDEICPCCIASALRDPLRLSDNSASANALHVMADKFLRRCCQIFESICLDQPCCYRALNVSDPSALPFLSAKRTRAPAEIPNSAAHPTVIFHVAGMDCATCAPKVSKAASLLAGVKNVNTDYMSQLASIEYDPDLIEVETIASFIQRATGFDMDVRSDRGGNSPAATRAVLPISTRCPIPDTFKMASVRRSKAGKTDYYEVSHEPRSVGAREIMEALGPSEPSLLPPSALTSDNQRREVQLSVLRAVVDLTCAIPVVVLGWGAFDISFVAKETVSLVLTTIVIALSWHIYSESARMLYYLRSADTNVLVSVSTLVAYVYSVAAFGLIASDVNVERPFFETPILLLALVQVGLAVQVLARRSVASTLSVEHLLPSSVVLIDPVSGASEIDARLLHYNDVIRVAEGEIFGADGIVAAGSSMAEESALTGESLPLVKVVGATVHAGTRNVEAPLDIQVTRLAYENTMAQLAELVRNSRGTRLAIEDLADRIAAIILVVTSAVAIVALLIWMLVERFVRYRAWSVAGVSGLTYAIAVIAVSCPCALVLATPLVISTILGSGLQNGVVIRNSRAMAELHKVDVFAFDKTGTMTDGRMRVAHHVIYSDEALLIVAALVAGQKHPISRAIANFVNESLTDSPIREKPMITIDNVEIEPGRGLRAIYGGYPLLGGSASFTKAVGGSFNARGLYSEFFVTLGSRVIAHFGLRDSLRPDSSALVRVLRSRGKEVVLISGDLDGPVQATGRELGIDPASLHSTCSPSGKLELVESFQASGKRVCFVGDGVNDTPALGVANVSIAISDGTDAAQASADIIINSRSSLREPLLNAVKLSNTYLVHVRAALGWSIFYNVFAVLFASGAFVNVRIEPKWAGLGEIISLLPVVLIAYGTRWTWKRGMFTKGV